MKSYTQLLLLASMFAVLTEACSKGGSSATPQPVAPKAETTTDMLVKSPWKISTVAFVNATTLLAEAVPVPDSLKNLVLTFNADFSYSETGAKTVTGTWAFVPQQENMIALTSGTPAVTANWNYIVSDSAFGLINNAAVTYINPRNTLQDYRGEALGFTH
ncbi:hypothetical protein HDF24_25595 [Mucilaginibacter sp. X4EP1]|uniref:hypothetical protein n=1 Tax=Mucilaginibacter sp. X4EP1 TaxID=2723092 RepID=UPI00216974C1|nr:hypothetical protein [Mucilaginibacter sp. X4EP1]